MNQPIQYKEEDTEVDNFALLLGKLFYSYATCASKNILMFLFLFNFNYFILFYFIFFNTVLFISDWYVMPLGEN